MKAKPTSARYNSSTRRNGRRLHSSADHDADMAAGTGSVIAAPKRFECAAIDRRKFPRDQRSRGKTMEVKRQEISTGRRRVVT